MRDLTSTADIPGGKNEPLHRLRLHYEQVMDRLREEYADTPAGYHDGQARAEAAARIEACLEQCRRMEGGEVTTPAFPQGQPFTGRQRELADLRSRLAAGQRIILVTGMGGIGKTSLLTAYAKMVQEGGASASSYDIVLFLPAGEGLKKAVTDDAVLSVSGMQWSARRYRSRQRYFREKVAALDRLARSRRLLLLVDDVREVRPRDMEALLSLPADILLSSRLTGAAFDALPGPLRPCPLPLTAMTDRELTDLALLLRPDLSAGQMQAFRQQSRRVGGHTLGLKLWLTTDGILPDADTAERLTFLDQRLERGARQYLMALSLLPPEGVPRDWAERVCGADPGLTDTLAAHSLLQLQEGQDGQQRVSLHPLIAENVRLTLRPGLKNCRHFLEGVAEDVSNAWNMPRKEMLVRLPAVQSILRALPDSPAWMAAALDRLYTFLWVMEDFQGAERGYRRLFENVRASCGEPSRETGWLAVRFGAVYHNSLRFDAAEQWYRRGLENLRGCRSQDPDRWWQHMEACGKCTRGPLFRGETSEVRALLEEASELYQRAPEEARTDRLLLTEAYHSRRMALFLLQQGQVEEARACRRRMHREMQLYFSRCGEDVPKQLDLRETDIAFALTLGDAPTAARLLEENLRGFRAYRGPDHEDTLHCMEQLADLYCRSFRQAPDQDLSGASPQLLYRARELYLQTASGLRAHYPNETAWLSRVEERIRTL